MISTNDQLFELSKCPSYLASKFGNRVHIASIYRWIKKGVAGVQLETLFVGGRRYTSQEALERFFIESTLAKNKDRLGLANHHAKQTQLEKHAEQLGI